MKPTSLRICLIASSRFPVAAPFMGGLEAHTHALARALVARGHDVALFAAPGSDPALAVRELPVVSSGDLPHADIARRDEHAYLELMLALADEEHGVFDVVHNNSLHPLPVVLSRLLSTPVVTTLHTPPLEQLVRAARRGRGVSSYVSVSRSIARAWSHVAPSTVVHNGVDTEVWREGPGGGGAVWAGRMVPEKAPHEAIDAARAAGLEIDLAGPVQDGQYYEREVLPRLGDDARHLGHLHGEELVDLVGRASVALVTSRWEEPFGLVAAEALSCGTPVAAYAVGGLGELLTDDVGRLVHVGDTGALARAAVEATRLDRRAARQHAEACFGLTTMVEAYEQVYLGRTGWVGAA